MTTLNDRNVYPWPDLGMVVYVRPEDAGAPGLNNIPHVVIDNIRMSATKVRTATVFVVYTPPKLRGRGIATDLMRRVMRDADQQGCRLELSVISLVRENDTRLEDASRKAISVSQEQLAQWYRRFGFRSTPGNPISMVRRPRSLISPVPTKNPNETSIGFEL